MKQYKSIASLKGEAKIHMFGNYSSAIGALILMNLILLMTSVIFSQFIPQGAAGQVVYYILCGVISLISGIFAAGNSFLYLNISSGRPVLANFIFYGFMNCAGKALKIKGYMLALEVACCLPFIVIYTYGVITGQRALTIFLVLTGILALVGGCLVNLIFMPAFYVLHDFPDYSVKKILESCTRIMRGNVGRLFLLHLSFVPIKLLELLSLGFGALFVEPYKNETLAEFYLDMMKPQTIITSKGI